MKYSHLLMTKNISFQKKLAVCSILSALSASTLLLLGTDIGKWISPRFILGLAAILFLTPYILLPIWGYLERKRHKSFSLLYNNAQDWVAFLTGFCIAIFGWKKIFGMQFRTPLSIADLPMSSQSGEALTWFYFGHSMVFGFIIAFFQITGSLLLCFRRTRLFGIFILLPVMLNIMLINIFYQLNPGALLQSLILTGALIYLISFSCREIIAFLFKAHDNPSRKKSRGWMFPVSSALLAFLFVRFGSSLIPKEYPVFGEYKVKNIIFNGAPETSGSCPANDSVLTRLYFDINNVCVMEYNSPERRIMANYSYHESDKTIQCSFMNNRNPKVFHVTVYNQNNKETELKGSLGNDSVQIFLIKAR
jgi:hypothetical protein